MIGKFIIATVLFTGILSSSYAQQDTSFTGKEADTLLQISTAKAGLDVMEALTRNFNTVQLPPLEELLERARNSPAMKAKYLDIEIQERELKSTRRQWLSYFRGNASYSYGKTNNYFLYQETNIPINDQYSSSARDYYLVGANISVSLYDLFNMRNKIKQQKARVGAAENNADIAYEQLQSDIIQRYMELQRSLLVLESATENLRLAQAQYEHAKIDFVNGTIRMPELSVLKSREVKAFQDFESVINGLNQNIIILEYLTGSKIINNR